MRSAYLQNFIELLDRSISMRASDIHISGGSWPYYRVDSEVQPLSEFVMMPEIVEGMADLAGVFLVPGSRNSSAGVVNANRLAFGLRAATRPQSGGIGRDRRQRTVAN